MVKSCGCIVFNNGKVLVIKQKNGDYGFPKGHIEDGETEEECAYRETMEETGIAVTIDSKFRFSVSYTVNKKYVKTAVYFISLFESGSIKIQEEELLDARWIDAYKVEDILTHDNLKNMWKKVYETYLGVYYV